MKSSPKVCIAAFIFVATSTAINIYQYSQIRLKNTVIAELKEITDSEQQEVVAAAIEAYKQNSKNQYHVEISQEYLARFRSKATFNKSAQTWNVKLVRNVMNDAPAKETYNFNVSRRYVGKLVSVELVGGL